LNGLDLHNQKSVQQGPGTLWNSVRIVILLGPPGAGKGTQAQRIAGQLGLQHLSTGDMLRDNIRRNTELARQAKPIIERGDLVPDHIILGMVQDAISQANSGNGFILDGFPRTLAQARGLEGIIRYYKSRSTTVVNIAVKPECLIHRLTNRRICKMHGHIYNISDRPPIHEGQCDVDGSELIQRPDDNEAVIRDRIHTYECHTRPLIDYYSARGLLREVRGVADAETVMSDILKILEKEEAAK
jgi:adenylate kinase